MFSGWLLIFHNGPTTPGSQVCMYLEVTSARSELPKGSVYFCSLLGLFNKSKPVSAVPG